MACPGLRSGLRLHVCLFIKPKVRQRDLTKTPQAARTIYTSCHWATPADTTASASLRSDRTQPPTIDLTRTYRRESPQHSIYADQQRWGRRCWLCMFLHRSSFAWTPFKGHRQITLYKEQQPANLHDNWTSIIPDYQVCLEENVC